MNTPQAEPVSKAAEPASEVAEPVSQTEEEQPQSEPQTHPSKQEIPADRTQQLLNNILGQLKSMQRTEMFSEFSIMRLMAGVVQMVVLFCLLITVWFLMSPSRQDSPVFIALGFAIVFQLMALTFYMMQGKR